MDNCFVESFNGWFRDECLNVHSVETIDVTKAKIAVPSRLYRVFCCWQAWVIYRESRQRAMVWSEHPL